MRKFDLELTVGLFVLAGILCLGYLSIKLARMEVLGGDGYEIYATFSNTGGLKEGASVVIAGVEVGRVKGITIEDYEAKVAISLKEGLEIQEDAIASVKTKGLIGEKYVQITPGGSEEKIQPGGSIRETQPAVDIEQLIERYIFGKI